jgi:L-alanine-DL-glutamate epimerase-like enolase superfamily enzyme
MEEMFTDPLPIADGIVRPLERPGLGIELAADLERQFPYQPGFSFLPGEGWPAS